MKENREKKEKTRIKHIFSIYRRDLYNMTHNPVAVVIMLGLLVLPSLYAWVNIVACWDPYGNTNGIKVAVVNLDRGVTLQGNTINAGDNIVESLRSNDAIGWQFVSEEDAEYGLTHDRYYAMLEIPEDFSEQLTDVFGSNYHKPEIIYRVNEKSNAIAPKITDTGAKTVTNEVTKAIIEVVDQVVFSIGNNVGEDIDNNEMKIKKLRDAVFAVNENFNELEAELEKANEGLATVEDLLESADATMPLLEDGVEQLQDFSVQSNQLLKDAEKLQTDGVDYAAGKFAQCQQFIDETRSLLQNTSEQLDNTEAYLQKVPSLVNKAEDLQETLEEVLTWLEKQDIKDPDYDKWLELLGKAETTAEKLTELLKQMEQNPEQVQDTLLAIYDTSNGVLLREEAALKLVETELKAQLEMTENEDERALLEQQLAKNQEAQELLAQNIAANREKREEIAAMTPEEVAAQIETLLQDMEQAQTDVQQITALVQQMKDMGVSIGDAVQIMEEADTMLGDGIRQVRSLLATADKALELADDIMLTAGETLDEIEEIMQDVTEQYNQRWESMLHTMFEDLYGTLDDLDGALLRADDALPQMRELLQQGNDTEVKGAELLAKLNEAVPAAKNEIQRLSAIMNHFTDENLDTIINLLENDSEASADYFSGPVELKTERLYHLDNYGSAMTPFYTVLALWVGCLLLSAILTTETVPIVEGRPNTMLEEYFGKMLTFLTMAFGQSLIVTLGDKFILGVTVADLGVFLIFSLFTAFIFILIVYSLVSILGNVGKAACVILLVFQIAGAGGTFPVEVMPEFYQILQPFLPFTYAIGAMREAISGTVAENLFYDFWHLAIFGAIGLTLGILLKKPLHPLLEWFNHKFKESGLSE